MKLCELNWEMFLNDFREENSKETLYPWQSQSQPQTQIFLLCFPFLPVLGCSSCQDRYACPRSCIQARVPGLCVPRSFSVRTPFV